MAKYKRSFEEFSLERAAKKKAENQTASQDKTTTQSKPASQNNSTEPKYKRSFEDFSLQKKYGATAQDWAKNTEKTLTEMQRYYSSWQKDDSSKYGAYSQQVEGLMLLGKKYREQYADDPDPCFRADRD